MNDLHPTLRRAFALSRRESGAPSSDLEERVLADWRQAAPVRLDTVRAMRLVLAMAAAVLLITCGISFRLLNETLDPSLVLTNVAIRGSLSHE